MRRSRGGAKRRGRRAARSGYVLLVALFVLVLTAALSAALALALTFRMERLRRDTAEVQLTALLDAGLAEAAANLAANSGWGGTGGEVPLGDGTYASVTEVRGLHTVVIRLVAWWGSNGRAAEADFDLDTRQIVAYRHRAFDPLDPLGTSGPSITPQGAP